MIDEQRLSGISYLTIVKINELKGLMNKYPQYHENLDGIIRLAVYNSINGDDALLNGTLEQVRIFDGQIKY
jgi:hypothetical protein